MRVRLRSGQSGMTLIEVVIAMAILAIVIAALYACGLTVMKMRLHNSMASESRSLGIQKLEAVASVGFDDIVNTNPVTKTETNYLADKYPVVRQVEVTGHTTNRTVETNLANSAYLEVHVLVSYYSAFTGREQTDSYSTIVLK